jgi:hypothetical protein
LEWHHSNISILKRCFKQADASPVRFERCFLSEMDAEEQENIVPRNDVAGDTDVFQFLDIVDCL